ncbi:Hsp20/alpha crystallin family protein [Candidatus Kaiserbacteria bacterium]|nr:Hsp20/alpha crystallin family protein [Candidatus Kaiserbacteria bacterium]
MPTKNGSKRGTSGDGKDKEKYPARWGDTPLRDVFDRFLDDRPWLEPFEYLRPPRMLSRFDRAYFPRVDMSETDAEIKVVADVPGINPDDIDITVRDDRLYLSGSTQREAESKEGERPYRYERVYGTFRRELSLPAHVDEENVRAAYKNGVLTITLPKTDVPQKKIMIEKE